MQAGRVVSLLRRYSSRSEVRRFQKLMKNRQWIIEDDISSTRATQLMVSLGTGAVLRPGEKVPLGGHFIYFNYSGPEEGLGSDGYERYQAPPENLYRRRLWVGGKIQYNADNAMVLGEYGNCIETVDKVVATGDRVFVTIDRKMFNGSDLSIRERRTLMYTQDLYSPIAKQYGGDYEKYKQWDSESRVRATGTLLFRYSALTFNSHKVHWQKEYAEKAERYPDVIAQGPLTATVMLQEFAAANGGVTVDEFSYKNKHPVFRDDEMVVKQRRAEDGWNVWIENQEGAVCVEGEVRGSEKIVT